MPTDNKLAGEIEGLKADIKLLLQYGSLGQIKHIAFEALSEDPAVREDCRLFLKKYGFGP
jgi:hypothetical protein